MKVQDQPSFEIPVPAQASAANATVAVRPKEAVADSTNANANLHAPSLTESPIANYVVGSAPVTSPPVNAGHAVDTVSSANHHAISSIEPAQSLDAVTKPTPAVRDISFHLPGTRGVEVRMSERAGEVRIDVRSGDSALTQDLRGNLHELVSSMDRKGLAAEVSHPVDSPSVRMGEMQASKDSSESQSNHQPPQEQNQDRRQAEHQPFFDGRSKKARTAAWQDAIDTHLETRPQ